MTPGIVVSAVSAAVEDDLGHLWRTYLKREDALPFYRMTPVEDAIFQDEFEMKWRVQRSAKKAAEVSE